MYPDPKKIKDIRWTVRLDQYEQDKLKEAIELTGEQPSVLLRKSSIDGLERLINQVKSMQRMVA